MVLQRDAPVHIWGHASAGESVTVSFRGEQQTAEGDRLGRWSVWLRPGDGGGPFRMTVTGTNFITVDDVLVGDLWVASGQSNMEFAMRQVADADRELAQINDPQIRLIRIEKKPSTYPRWNASGTAWEPATSQSAREFSAVAYYFAREMRAHTQLPVGVIESSWGGTPGEAWTSLDALASDSALMPVFAARAHMVDMEETNEQLQLVERQAIDKAKAEGKPAPAYPWHPPLDTWAPGELYNSMIAPLTDLKIRGVIWYQGEANSGAERAPLYERVFKTLIADWRKKWNEPDMPFLYVQLANFRSSPLEDWAAVREAQWKTLDLRNTAMAVTIDVGNPDDVHPVDKLTVGHRLALAARARVFGESIEYSGPELMDVAQNGSSLRLRFAHADGLQARGVNPGSVEVAGIDGVFKPATVEIEKNSMIVKSPEVRQPQAVRYAWSNSPVCTIFNGVGLPASPFTARVR
jgi:sialate O-acetylesterase